MTHEDGGKTKPRTVGATLAVALEASPQFKVETLNDNYLNTIRVFKRAWVESWA
jgi:hypothetical protein